MAVILLPPDLSASQADALKTRLAKALGKPGDVVFDGNRVVELSTPALQVLLAAAQKAAGEGRAVSLRDASDKMRAALNDFGLDGVAPWGGPG